MEYFPKTLSKEETTDSYKKITAFIDQKGFGLFAAEEKESGEYLGFIGFNRPTFSSYFTPCIEIGWRLEPTFLEPGICNGRRKSLFEVWIFFPWIHRNRFFYFNNEYKIDKRHEKNWNGVR